MLNMKKILLFGACAAVAFLTSCSSGPSAVAEDFLTDLAKGNYEEAKSYCSENTKGIIDLAVAFGHKPVEDYTVEIVKDSIDGDNAWVWYIDEKGKEQKLELKKIDGKWLVDISK
jgi:hypothetical protein